MRIVVFYGRMFHSRYLGLNPCESLRIIRAQNAHVRSLTVYIQSQLTAIGWEGCGKQCLVVSLLITIYK